MKNYLKSVFYKAKDGFIYYEKLSLYTQKKYKFKLLNFLCLIKYIIFEEVSYILKLKPRIMNQLEAQELIEKAKKYIGKTIILNPYDPITFKRVKYNCRYDGVNFVTEASENVVSGDGKILSKGKVNVQVTAIMTLVDNESKFLPYGLQFVVKKYKEQEK